MTLEFYNLLDSFLHNCKNSIRDYLETNCIYLSSEQAIILMNLPNRPIPIKSVVYYGVNASYNINQLHKKGYVTVEKDSVDYRMQMVSITAKGKSVIKVLDKFFSAQLSDNDLLIQIKKMDKTIDDVKESPAVKFNTLRTGSSGCLGHSY